MTNLATVTSKIATRMKRGRLLVWLAGMLAAWSLLIFERDLLWKIQEMNLFLFTPLFFQQQMVVPGGMLTYLGTFFTQFLFHPGWGIALLGAWWWLLMWLTKRTFRLPDKWEILLLFPIVLLLLTNADMGYWVYVLKLRGYFFVTTIGTTAVVAALWGYRSLPEKRSLRIIYILAVTAIGYPLIGIYALAATLLMGIWAVTAKKDFITGATALLCVLAIPLIYYRFVYYQTNVSNIYWAELPLYYIRMRHTSYYAPFYLLAAYYLALVVTYQEKHTEDITKRSRWIATQIVIAGGLLTAVILFWYKDENFHHELRMQRHLKNMNWNGVLEEAAQQKDEPTRAIVIMRNIALARLGRQAEEMYRYRNGSKRYRAPFNMRLMQVIGPLIYYHYGVTNYSYRLCMEMGVEYDWRPEYYKLMTKCAILNGEDQVAKKYLNLLKKTLFFKGWAEHYEPLVGNPKAIAKDPEMNFITHMMQYHDKLDSDQGMVEPFLMKLIATTDSTDPIFQEQALIASLWFQDSQLFWHHLVNYLQLHQDRPLPRYFQEAAYLFAQKDKRSDINQLPFDAGIKEGFEQFMRASVRYEGADIEVARKDLYPYFGDTFYYHYFLMSNLKQY